jgi:hypothetical protein
MDVGLDSGCHALSPLIPQELFVPYRLSYSMNYPAGSLLATGQEPASLDGRITVE